MPTHTVAAEAPPVQSTVDPPVPTPPSPLAVDLPPLPAAFPDEVPDEVPDEDRLPTPGSGGLPVELRARMHGVQRSGSSSTKPLLEALAPLRAAGATPHEAAMAGFGRFPVAGQATYTHDWLFPRFGPGWRLHQGTDIFAPMGTPVRAPADGRVRLSNGGLGGTAVYVIEADGTYYYLAHLAGVAPGLAEGDTVGVGQLIGYNGNSGNARGTPPHVHFEVHPQGGGPVDPKPVLDRFLAEALAAAPEVVADGLAGGTGSDDTHTGSVDILPSVLSRSPSERPEPARLEALSLAGAPTPAPSAGGHDRDAPATLAPRSLPVDARHGPTDVAEVLTVSLAAAAAAVLVTRAGPRSSRHPRRLSRPRRGLSPRWVHPHFTDENATAMIIGDDAVMLLVERIFETLTKKQARHAAKATEAIIGQSGAVRWEQE